MVFSSFLFLFLFLPLVVIINRFLPIRWSNVFLLLVSLFFYFAGEGVLAILLVGSIAWNYAYGWCTKLVAQGSIASKAVLGAFLSGNIGLLLYYKYAAFLIENLGLSSFIPKSQYAEIVLPIGISFFTFQGIGYCIDVYRKTTPPERSPVKLGLYIAFFPQLIAGPILKFNQFAPYLSKRTVHIDQSVAGSSKFIRGLAKKVLLANNFGLVADVVFELDPSELSTPIAWLGILLYTLQIYFDFSGYSDMAIGLGKIMGFHIPENFKHPYIAKSLQEFWRRWHISLSTWFKEYLYIPLGGNRKGSGRTYVNLLIVFFITGLWHGSNYTFIVWGLVHGFFLIIERLRPASFPKAPAVLGHAYVLFVVMMAWVLFRSESMELAFSYLEQLFAFTTNGNPKTLLYMQPYLWILIGIGVLLATPMRSFLKAKWKAKGAWKTKPHYTTALVSFAYIALLLYCLMERSVATHTPFIYFKF